MRQWRRLATIWMSGTAMIASAQMAEQGVVDLQAGLLVHATDAIKLSDKEDEFQPHGFDPPGGKPVAVGDFTLSATLTLSQLPVGEQPRDFLALLADSSCVLGLAWSAKGGVVIEGDVLGRDQSLVSGPVASPQVGRPISITLSIRRDPRQALSAVWLDGVERLSFNVPPGTSRIGTGPLGAVVVGTGSLRHATLSHLRLYDRALTRPEIIALAQQDTPKPQRETLALIGGTEAVLMAESGWLEAYLALKSAAAPEGQRTTLRNLAWEGDTVWRQDRPLNFGPLAQQLARVQAQRVVLMFGRQECLERGEAGLADFRTALDALVAKCPRGALLMGCVPFDAKPPPQRDLSALNPVLDRYNHAIQAVAEAHGGTFFDTAKSWRKQEQPWTRDGVTLNAKGEWLLGDVTAFALGWLGQNPSDAGLAQLRTLAQAKEALWHRYWRPSNWAFLYGDRTTQPSSRDHLNPNVRWFPQELEQYRALMEAKENELWNLSQEMGRKLP